MTEKSTSKKPPTEPRTPKTVATGELGKRRPKPKSKAKTAGALVRRAKFAIGDVVRHRVYPFRGVIFDIDVEFNNTEEWWLSIPEEVRPRKDQPFYHLLAENEETEYVAYVSEQNLMADESGEPLRHPRLSELFTEDEAGRFALRQTQSH
jgi:heat shock protein HspQ